MKVEDYNKLKPLTYTILTKKNENRNYYEWKGRNNI